jgi:hypothetical protein
MLMTPVGMRADLWSTYSATLAFRDKLIGGVPKDPRLIEGWLRAKAGINDGQELRQAMLRTLAEIGVDVHEDASDEALTQASTALASQRRTTGFKIDGDELYVESRQVKAMLKESTNVVFAGERWGPTRKAARSFFAERVFVGPDKLRLGVAEPTGVETIVGHVAGPAGPRSTLGYYEYVQLARLEFGVQVLRDCITPDQWLDIWGHAQENGFGALRSQGYGRFDLVQWRRVVPPPPV